MAHHILACHLGAWRFVFVGTGAWLLLRTGDVAHEQEGARDEAKHCSHFWNLLASFLKPHSWLLIARHHRCEKYASVSAKPENAISTKGVDIHGRHLLADRGNARTKASPR
jgi:hypothetical protein